MIDQISKLIPPARNARIGSKADIDGWKGDVDFG